LNKNKQSNKISKRTITNSDDLKNYLTKDKLNEFKRQINEFTKIAGEIDKKIIGLNKQNMNDSTNENKNTILEINDDYDLNVLVSALAKL